MGVIWTFIAIKRDCASVCGAMTAAKHGGDVDGPWRDEAFTYGMPVEGLRCSPFRVPARETTHLA